MNYLLAFAWCGGISMLGQIVYEHTKWTPGHITSLFVVLGVLLDFGQFYDKVIEWCQAGALLPITSFGHSLVHAALERAAEEGFIGIFTGIFDRVAAGLAIAVLLSFLVALVCKPRS